jgi:hypothetical protein
MSAVPLQRPVAPWSQHGYWGQFDDPASLPNVAGSDYQIASDVQAGDIAFSVSDSSLYLCLTPTSEAAIWSPLIAGGGGGDTLQTAYNAGNTIAVIAAEGSVALSASSDATDVLTIDRSFAGAGDGIAITMGATTTGSGISIDAGGTGFGLLVAHSTATGVAASLTTVSTVDTTADYGEVIRLAITGTGAEVASILVGNADPNGDVTGGDVGSLFLDGAGGAAYVKTANPSTWVDLGAGGGGGTLQDAYDAGNTIAVVAADGPVALSNAADATDVLTIERTFVGSGDGIDINMAAGTTGRGLRVVVGGTGTGVLVTDGLSQLGISPGLIFQSSGNDLNINVLPGGGVAGNLVLAVGTDTTAGGDGGDFSATAGPGTAHGAGTGGAGGSSIITGGAGGDSSGANPGGAGGVVSLLGGVGGVSATGQSGTGSLATIVGGLGGDSSGGAGTAGLGGNVEVTAGDAGADNGGTGAVGGSILINAGAGTGVAADGAIQIAPTTGTVAFFGVTPVAQSAAYTPTNVVPDRAYDAAATTVSELANVLGAVIADLQAIGIFG